MFEEQETVTVQEFKAWLVGMIRGKGGTLPDLDDWKQIKKMLDKVEAEKEIVYLPYEDGRQNLPYQPFVPYQPFEPYRPPSYVGDPPPNPTPIWYSDNTGGLPCGSEIINFNSVNISHSAGVPGSEVRKSELLEVFDDWAANLEMEG